MVKIIHIADVHFDSPLSMPDLQKSEIRRQEISRSFVELIALAKKENAQFLLISGDLFDSSYVSRDTVEMLRRAFATIDQCKVIIAPGNHDPYVDGSVYKRVKFSENVFIFNSPEIGYFDFPELNTTVYGYAFVNSHMEVSPICNKRPVNPDRINLLVAHADTLSPISKYCPVTSADLENSEFDYIALGHIHNSDGIHRNSNNKYYGYSGCLEGRGFDETGEKGAYLIEVDKTSNELVFKSEFVGFSKRIYKSVRLDVSGVESQSGIVEKIKALIAEKNYGERHALKIILEGFVDPMVKIFPQHISEQIIGLFSLNVVDETYPAYDARMLENDKSIKGAFYLKLKPMLECGAPEERKKAALALKYGLIALSGGEPAEI